MSRVLKKVLRRPRVLLTALLVVVLTLGGSRVYGHFLGTSNPCGTLSGVAADSFRSTGSETALGIAHNAGTDANEVGRAVTCGAGAVELDIVGIDGQLRVAHDVPAPSATDVPPALADLWPIAARAGWVNLDLKDGSPAFLGLVVDFLSLPPDDLPDQVSVSSPDPMVLAVVAERLPDVLRFQSIGDEDQFGALRASPGPDVITGVSIEEKLVDEDAVRWLTDNGLDVWVWQVSDPMRARDLLELGVSGLITDNLVLLDALRDD